ncbi:AraC family transcriptional regulator [Klebsiella pneumoniae]|uniref:AraC family transcriptional regulator n=1 Tax=Paenibacillus antri TaxID=2582848 RepID=A0A5R9GIL2_9BACL|nr:AraC family transcriptional regulator [Paenibacillus antri]TLS53238.1 AraC family transcriptional regulator [Paenibacillus antri]TMY87283.1 AraC family transcriptional regulator [Klebsiella pneumoniae]
MHEGSVNDMLPVVNFASRDAADAGNYWGPRVIPDYQLFYVASGEARLTVGEEEHRIDPGQFAYFGYDHPHRLQVVRPTEYFSIHFLWNGPSSTPVHPAYGIREVDEAMLRRAGGLHRVECPGFGSVELPHRLSAVGVEPILTRIVKEYRQEQPGYPAMLRAHMTELLMELLRSRMEGGAASRRGRIDVALRAMREQPAKPWTVAELASLCGYHPSYFTLLFSREMGRKPKHFLIHERIKQAKQALLRGEAIDSIAERLGYGSIHYFSNNFKKETGLSPSEFRQRPDRGSDG